MNRKQTNTVIEESGQGEMEINQTKTPKFKFEPAPKMHEDGGHLVLDLTKDGEGPMAMTYDMELGWVVETLVAIRREKLVRARPKENKRQ